MSMKEKRDLDQKIIQILGDDHPISEKIKSEAEDLEITTVLLATFSNLSDRLDVLEDKMRAH